MSKQDDNKDDKQKIYTVSKMSYTMRVLVALYLLYTVWQLRETPFTSEGTERAIFIVAIIVFLAVGVVIGYSSLKALIKKEYSENNPADIDEFGTDREKEDD